MCSFAWQDGPEPDIDKWEENVWEQYQEYLEDLHEGDKEPSPMSFEAYRDQIMEEMGEHIAELQESYN